MARHKKTAKLKMATLGKSLEFVTHSRVPKLEKEKPSKIKTAQGTSMIVVHPVDPFSQQEREEAREISQHSYVNRLLRILVNTSVGNGFTIESRLGAESDEDIGKKIKNLDLDTLSYSLLFNALVEGRSAGVFTSDNQIRNVSPEYLQRPVVDQDTGEMVGVYVVGAKNNIVESKDLVYLALGQINELFSDYYGMSRVISILEEAKALHQIQSVDFKNIAFKSWFTPPIYSVPVPPQEYGNEEGVLHEFLQNVSNMDGAITAVTRSSNKEDIGVEILSQQQIGANAGNPLIPMTESLIKVISSTLGVPGFMVEAIETGSLGTSVNVAQMDSFINTEILPLQRILEQVLQTQVLDRLFGEDNVSIKFLRPNLSTLLTPEQYGLFKQMVVDGHMTNDDLKEKLGLGQPTKFSVARGIASDEDTSKNKITAI